MNTQNIEKSSNCNERGLLNQHWYQKVNWVLSILLLPFSLIYFIVSSIRLGLYRSGLYRISHLPIPIVIVGNISVGGTGKTPLTKYLVQELAKRNIKAGVILRGYGGKIKSPYIVNNNDLSTDVGDEALIYTHNQIKVAIGANRFLAGRKLLTTYPKLDLIISDDGLQHYALHRDYEIAVIDSTRMLGNRFVLPMGPLRETTSRLKNVDIIISNGSLTQLQKNSLPHSTAILEEEIIFDKIYNPKTKIELIPADLHDKRISTMVGIGNPARFFNLLSGINIHIPVNSQHIFPDHHQYLATDIPQNSDIILVTEKDYVKLAQFNNPKIYVVLVRVSFHDSQLIDAISSLVSTQ